MLELTIDPAFAREVVRHAFATKYVTIAGFSILLWDHACTFQDEVLFMWPAPRSLVKALFLGNRYFTPLFQAITLYQMTRPTGFSNTFCKTWNLITGFVEITSMASLDLLLLFRLHALWHNNRKIVIGTFALYSVVYISLVAAGIKAAIDLTPHIHYSVLAKMCSSDYRPTIMSALWSFVLVLEIIVFVMTAIKALKERRANEIRTPIVKSLYRDQFFYYIIIIFFRAFNLAVWSFLPPSLLYIGAIFIWALVNALVTRIMLNLRRVACSSQTEETVFGETAYSTRIVWARRNDGTFDSTIQTITSEEGQVVDATGAASEAPIYGDDHTEEGGEGIQLHALRRNGDVLDV